MKEEKNRHFVKLFHNFAVISMPRVLHTAFFNVQNRKRKIETTEPKRTMKAFLTAIVLTSLSTGTITAQSKYAVSGTVIEKETNEAVVSATVQVLSLPDSSFVAGVATNSSGGFTMQNVTKGRYALKVSFIGYQNKIISLDLTKAKSKKVDIGYITLQSDAVMLKEAKIYGNAAKIQMSGDSLVYNASAYKMAAGSALEDLVKKLPGAQVDDDGNITINGKTVTKILLDGKEFFLNDTKTAMKNIPTDMIEKIKSYDRKSDLARVTGIDDGEEETVIDLTVKKNMKHGWVGNFDLGMGTEKRYSERMMLNRFTDHASFSLVGSANNTNDAGFGGGGGRGPWGRRNGLNSSKTIGFNFATETDKLETDGSVRYRYDGSDAMSESSTQNFVTSTGAFNNSISKSLSSNSSVNANFRMEWKPDTMTNIIFRPSGSYSRNRGYSNSSSATFNEDPNKYADDPLTEVEEMEGIHGSIVEDEDVEQMMDNIMDIVVNTNRSRQQTYSNSRSINGELQANRRLNNEGRNVTLRATGGLRGSDSKQLSASRVAYSQESGKDEDVNNRYYTTPGRGSNYSIQMTYSEPIAKKTYLQFSYRFNYSYTKNDRQAFTYDAVTYTDLSNALMANRYDIPAIVDYMLAQSVNDPAYSAVPNDNLSQFSEYKNYNHTISLMLRIVRDNYNFNVGVDALPQTSKLNYKYMGHEYPEVERNVFNFTPTLDYRYKFSKTSQLRFTYRGRTSQPSMTNLLDITDDSDPLNIRKGNPGLKPSFASNFRMFYNTYNTERQQGMFSHVYFGMTQNSISNMVSYDEATGVRTTMPMNINGNWNAGGMFGFNTAVDKNKSFTINSFTRVGYDNQVSYLDPKQYEENKSKTRKLTLAERLEFGYRNDWFEASLNGNIDYNHSRNNVVENSDLDTYQFTYGAEVNVTLPWGTRIVTDIAENSRRGYSQSAMNTNELIWNAQISHSFLKGKALTLSLEVNDILKERSNISRTITAMQSSDTRYNAIYQYGMIRAIYKLNIFGGKNVMGTDKEGQGGPGGPGGGPGRGPRR